MFWVKAPTWAASTAELHVGDALARARLLAPGARLYLRYNVKGDSRELIDMWRREIRIEPLDGRKAIHIVQRWDGIGEHPYVLEQDAWFEVKTFRPITQLKRVTRDGKTTVGGYRFYPDKVVGMDEVPDNVRKGFSVADPGPSYNFETDMELLQMLPLGPGYEVSIPFYDPGLQSPKRYIFKVAGAERIHMPDGRLVDCWVVTADYGRPDPPTRFWFDKRTQVLLREESLQKDGSTLVKTLVTPDVELSQASPTKTQMVGHD